jgi:hypothetical protein
MGVGSEVRVLASADEGSEFGDFEGVAYGDELPQGFGEGRGNSMLELMALQTVAGLEGF